MTKKRFKFTKTAIDAIPLTTGGNDRGEYRDTDLRGLVLRVSKTAKTYYLFKRDPNSHGKGGQVKVKLGTTLELSPEDARRKAAKLLSGDGGIRAAKLENEYATIEQLAATFDRRHIETNLKPNSQRDYRRQLEKFIVPWWGSLDPRLLTSSMVREKFEDRSEDAPYQANKMLVVLSSMLSFAVEREVVDFNVCDRVKPNPTTRRKRLLTHSELETLLTCLNEVEPVKRHYVWLLVLLGQRRSETVLVTWDMLKQKKDTLVLPPEITKNGLSHSIPLPPLAQAHFNALRFHTGSVDRCFYSWEERHNRKPGPLNAQYMTLFMRRFREAHMPNVERFTPHDLRRTVATNVAELVKRREDVKRLLNHVDQSDVTGVYDLYSYDDVKLNCLTKWEERIRSLVPESVIERSLEPH